MGTDPAWLVAWALLAAALVAIGWLVRRERELFRLRADRGTIVAVRGRIPPALLTELSDVIGRARASCIVVAERSDGRASVRVSGEVSRAVVQQLRNVVGRFPVAKITSAPRRRAGG